MATWEESMSSSDLFRAYLTERFRPAFFIPLGVLLYLSGKLALGLTTTTAGKVVGAVVAYLLVLSFRIADDIADVPFDREQHPRRITVVTRDLSPLKAIATRAF